VISALLSVVFTYLAPPVAAPRPRSRSERDGAGAQLLGRSPVEAYDTDSGDFYYTNYELLKSRTLAERAVEGLGLHQSSSLLANAEPPRPQGEPPEPVGGFLHEFFNRLRGPRPRRSTR
jgi:hypothetical protein